MVHRISAQKTHKLLDLLTESWFVIPSVANSNTPSKTQKLWTGFPSLALGHKKSRGKLGFSYCDIDLKYEK